MALVKAPLTWPKRVDSSRSDGMAPVLTGMNMRVAARGVGVDGLGDELLAGAGFALDEHGGAAGRNLRDGVEQAQHGLGLADDVFEVVALLERALELDDFGFGLVAGDGGADVGEQFLVVPGLLDEVFGARADGVDDVVDRAEGGDHDDGQVGVKLGDARQEVDAALAGESEVEQQKVVLGAREGFEAGGAVDGEGDVEAFEREQGFERLADARLVVDDEQVGYGGGGYGRFER